MKEICNSVSEEDKSLTIMSSNSRSFEVKSEVGIEFNPFYIFCCGDLII